MTTGPWTDSENDLIVAEYFAMLQNDWEGRQYSKAEHRCRLQTVIERSKPAIEYKHQNISAVIKGLGEAWLPGYPPAFNYQRSLEDAVIRWLERNSVWLERVAVQESELQLQDAASLWIGPPPTLSNQPAPPELEQTQALARKFDIAARDERNRALGRAGEQYVLARERGFLSQEGRRDLAERVCWVSEEHGDGAGYDIKSFTPEGSVRLIEVKTTNGWERTPFHISRNELAVAEMNRAEWNLLRLWDFSRHPKAFELQPPLDRHVTLTPTTFQASFH